jgi:ABC-2 type transport system permease protein
MVQGSGPVTGHRSEEEGRGAGAGPVTGHRSEEGRPAVPPVAARVRDVLAFEWTKLSSIRSNAWTLLAASAVTVGSTAIVAQAIGAAPKAPPGGVVTPLTASFLGYAEYAVIPVSILAVLSFTSEYSTGLIRTTLTAVPRRLGVLAAKAAVTGGIALAAGEVLAFTAFFLAQAILGEHHRGVSLGSPGTPRAVLAAGLLLAVCALTGLGLGAVTRRTPGGISATIAVIYLLGVLCLLMPHPWNTRVGRFTLPFAAHQLVTQHPLAGLFSPGTSLLIVLAWPAAALLAAAVALTRRDA